MMMAFISDESGINLSAGGIGHEITAVMDDDYSNEITLNDYYVQAMDNFRSGSITYPFHKLPDGTHTLTLKAWDNYNNSAEKTISFVINSNGPLELNQVFNYPNPLITAPLLHLIIQGPAINWKLTLKSLTLQVI